MSATANPIEQLEQIATEFHHLSKEYKREGERGSTRRTLEKRLEELDESFDRLLQHWVSNEPKRKAWHEHLHHDAPRPDDELVQSPPVFVGISESGSEIQVQLNAEGLYDVLVDGVCADTVSTRMAFPQHGLAHILDQDWNEITHTNQTALKALRRYCAEGQGAPPWEWARVLYSDGLIDVNFSLTPRGQRIL